MSTAEATLAAIDAEIHELEARVNSLQSARELLVEEVAEEAAPKRSRKPSSSKAPAKSSRRVVVEDDDDEEDEAPKRRSHKASTKDNGTKSGPSRKQIITKMLGKGQSPREIADELGIQPNYVYHVKRDLESDES